jgi:hypothetical protein
MRFENSVEQRNYSGLVAVIFAVSEREKPGFLRPRPELLAVDFWKNSENSGNRLRRRGCPVLVLRLSQRCCETGTVFGPRSQTCSVDLQSTD